MVSEGEDCVSLSRVSESAPKVTDALGERALPELVGTTVTLSEVYAGVVLVVTLEGGLPL
jgi:hypothetical protein